MTACRKNLSTGLTRQIPFRRTFGVTCMDLAITMSNKKVDSTTYILGLIEVMANLSPPDLWDYVHGLGQVSSIDLANKFEVLAHDKSGKPINYASSNNICWWHFSHIVAGAQPLIKGRCTRTLLLCYVQDVQDLQKRDAARVRARSLLSRLPIVRPSQARLFQALLYEHHLFRSPSHDCSWRVRTGGCQLLTIRVQ